MSSSTAHPTTSSLERKMDYVISCLHLIMDHLHIFIPPFKEMLSKEIPYSTCPFIEILITNTPIIKISTKKPNDNIAMVPS